ncbi:putative ubiquinone biosynthesis monooxygenase [Marasmius sp. AFHP31]|nr:putative ubiquinone biosynthesis monooxygenase [Marasmius sp. AFHP31]
MLRASGSKACRVVRCTHVRWSSTSTAQPGEYDVVIVGGGPAGLALAGALGSKQALRETLKIALVEASDLSKVHDWNTSTSPDIFSNRVSSLTNVSQAFLKDIGAWNEVESGRTATLEEMQVWDGVSDARITFSAAEIGLEHPEEGMARITENLNLQRGLLRHIRKVPGIDVLDKTKVQSITSEGAGQWPLVHLDNNQTLKARLLVGADGLNSPVRAFAQIPSFGWMYDTHGVVATMHHPPRSPFENPNTTAYQRFLPTGPIAFLPLSPTVSSLVWSTKPALASALKACDPSVVARMINAAFRLPEVSLQYLHDRILSSHTSGTPTSDSDIRDEIRWREQSHAIDPHSAYSSSAFDIPAPSGIPPADSQMVPPLVKSLQPGTVASFPLRFNHTEAYIGEGKGARTVLVGDAAHTIHPLAGQGLNLGLGDVECLARCIENVVLAGGDIGSYTALLPYTQERYFENHKVMAACDKLHKLYSTTLPPVVWARSMGLEVVNELDSIKAALMMTAGSTSATGPSNAALNVNGGLGQTVFSMAATGFQAFATANKTVQAVQTGLTSAATRALQATAKAATGPKVLTQEKFFSEPVAYAGGITKAELRHSDVSLPEVCEAIQERLVEELDAQIRSITELLPEDEDPTSRTAEALVSKIQNLVEEVPSLEEKVDLSQKHVEEIVGYIKAVRSWSPFAGPGKLISQQGHVELQNLLSESMGKYPPALNKRRASEDALTATTIETSLIKLSLIRARCHQALYNFKSETHPDATMSNALKAAYDSLEEEGIDLEEEERALDVQLFEYRTLLEIVDGEHMGFGQLVDDWVRVQKETEDCGRDLRRLGWIGE